MKVHPFSAKISIAINRFRHENALNAGVVSMNEDVCKVYGLTIDSMVIRNAGGHMHSYLGVKSLGARLFREEL